MHRLHLDTMQCYALARDPYSRLESFYKDKLQANIRDKIKTGEDNWQDSQRVFFPLLGLNDSTPPAQIAGALMGVTFTEFISSLPLIYTKDVHLHPQAWAMKLNCRRLLKYAPRLGRRLGLSIPLAHIFKMESQADMQDLGELFGIDIDKKYNNTECVDAPIQWGGGGGGKIDIVNRIYDRDFTFFGYEKRPTTSPQDTLHSGAP